MGQQHRHTQDRWRRREGHAVRERRQIRGYGVVWELKAQVQHIPGKHGNIPLWFPVAVSGIAYFLVVMVLVWVLRHLPLLELITSRPPLLVAYVLFPMLCAFLLTVLEPHGRSAPRHLLGMVRDRATPRERYLGRPIRPAGRPAVVDGVTAIASTPRSTPNPHGRVVGPAKVVFNEPVAPAASRLRRRRVIARRPDAAPDWPAVRTVRLGDKERLTTRL
jgi:hypothetical protein